MADEWKYKEYPSYLKGKPGQWGHDEKDWVAFDGMHDVVIKNLPETQKVEVTNQPVTQDVKDDLVLAKLVELETKIQATNEALAGTININVTGSIAELDIKPNLKKIPVPLGFRWKNHPLNGRIYFDPETKVFTTDFDMIEMKYNGTGKTYFVDVNTGSNTNDGLSKQTAFKTLRKALDQSDVMTVMIAGGLYNRSQGLYGFLEKSVNVIAYDGVAKISMHEELNFTSHVTLTNVYVANRSGVASVFDVKFEDDDGDYLPMIQVATEAEVETTPNSFYENNETNDLLIRTKDDRVPDADVRVYLTYNNTMRGDIHVYLDGIEFEGGARAVWAYCTDANNVPDLYLKNCTIKYSTFSNGLRIEGANVYSQNTVCSKNAEDGFNYHSKYGVNCKVIEINCSGKDNGTVGNTTNNGSTIHDGGSIIRLNGEYIRNHGPNIGDVNDGTQSWNVGTISFNSLTETSTQNSDFTADGKVDMWLDHVVGYGSVNSLDIRTNAKAYVRDSTFTTEEIIGNKYTY